MTDDRQRVLIVGGGYVAINAYRTLRRTARKHIRVTVVSSDSHHYFHGFTGEIVAGILPYLATRTPLTDVFGHAEFVHGQATRVDLDRRVVTAVQADGGDEVEVAYDHLILACGAVEPTRSVPGLAEYGHTLRAYGRFADMLEGLGLMYDELPDDAGIVVVGGGFAGVEIAAAARDRSRAAGIEVPVLLVHSGDRILPQLREWPSLLTEAERQLKRLGVEVKLNTRVTAVTATDVEFDDGTRMPASFVLGTIGMDPVRIDGLEPLARDEAQRIVTERTLQVAPGVWAAGDVARVAHVTSGEPVPANALWAIKTGELVGRNVGRVITGRTPRTFDYRGLGQTASFGLWTSIAELYRMPITGPIGWVLRMGFFLRFMPTRKRAGMVVRSLLKLPFNRGRYPVLTDRDDLKR